MAEKATSISKYASHARPFVRNFGCCFPLISAVEIVRYISDLDSMQEEEKKKEVAAANTSSENRETDKYNPGASVVKVEEEEKA